MSQASAKRRNEDFARRIFTDIFKRRCINWLSDVQRNDAGERPVAGVDCRRARDPLRRSGVDHPLASIRGRTTRTGVPRFLPCSPGRRPSFIPPRQHRGGRSKTPGCRLRPRPEQQPPYPTLTAPPRRSAIPGNADGPASLPQPVWVR